MTRCPRRALRKPRHRSQVEGFTLLETLVALAILGMALGSSISVYSDAVTRSRHAAMEAEAAGIAEALFAQLGTTLPAKKSPIRDDDPHVKDAAGLDPHFHWRIDFVPYDLEKLGDKTPVKVALVTVEVQWFEANQPKFLTVHSLRAGLKEDRQ
jgi:prepilin-type N-terminal cleavage/methylation domain-containing protein